MDGSPVANMPASLLEAVAFSDNLVSYATTLRQTCYAAHERGRSKGRSEVQTDIRKALGL